MCPAQVHFVENPGSGQTIHQQQPFLRQPAWGRVTDQQGFGQHLEVRLQLPPVPTNLLCHPTTHSAALSSSLGPGIFSQQGSMVTEASLPRPASLLTTLPVQRPSHLPLQIVLTSPHPAPQGCPCCPPLPSSQVTLSWSEPGVRLGCGQTFGLCDTVLPLAGAGVHQAALSLLRITGTLVGVGMGTGVFSRGHCEGTWQVEGNRQSLQSCGQTLLRCWLRDWTVSQKGAHALLGGDHPASHSGWCPSHHVHCPP